MMNVGTSGDDKFSGSATKDILCGDPLVLMVGRGQGGDDLIHGLGDTDYIYGEAMAMHGFSVGGGDTLFGDDGTISCSGKACSWTATPRVGSI
jgi:serralysin